MCNKLFEKHVRNPAKNCTNVRTPLRGVGASIIRTVWPDYWSVRRTSTVVVFDILSDWCTRMIAKKLTTLTDLEREAGNKWIFTVSEKTWLDKNLMSRCNFSSPDWSQKGYALLHICFLQFRIRICSPICMNSREEMFSYLLRIHSISTT